MQPVSSIRRSSLNACAACLTLLAAAPLAAGATDTDPVSISVAQAVRDMKKPHEGVPYGVPASYNWRSKPVVYELDPAVRNFRSITGWGQIFRVDGTAPVSLRVAIRNLRTYVLTDSGELELVQSENAFDGAQFDTTYKDNRHTQATLGRDAQGNLIVTTNPHAAFHFWPTAPRPAIDPRTVRGVIVTLEARLDPEAGRSGADLRKRVVLSVGADYWLAKDSDWDRYRTNQGIGVGRFEYIGSQWKCYAMTTISPREANALKKKIEC